MSQAPAVPKHLRWRRLAAAHLGLASSKAAGLLASERAALDLRQQRQCENWAPPQQVHFLLPLVGPDAVKNWDVVTTLLDRTLRRFQSQTEPRWRATICCQTRPPLPDDPRFAFLPFSDNTAGNDKWRKLDALYDHLGRNQTGSGLAMTFDADDLAAPSLVHTLLQRPRGTLLTHGLVFDLAENLLARAFPQSLVAPRAKAFWKLCGSCAALPFDLDAPSRQAQITFLRNMSQHEHRMIPYLAALAGAPLTELPSQEVVYLLNHGENFGARRGRLGFKTRFAKRFAIDDGRIDQELRERFGLDEFTDHALK